MRLISDPVHRLSATCRFDVFGGAHDLVQGAARSQPVFTRPGDNAACGPNSALCVTVKRATYMHRADKRSPSAVVSHREKGIQINSFLLLPRWND